jgi:hypothetical protein
MAFGCKTGRKVGGFVRFDDHDVAIDYVHFVRPDRQFGRRFVHASGAEVEPGCVKWALDPTVLHVAIG